MASIAPVFVGAVTLRRKRLPWASKPRLTDPRQRPWQCRWNLASVHTVPVLCSNLTPRAAATARNLHPSGCTGGTRLAPRFISTMVGFKIYMCPDLPKRLAPRAGLEPATYCLGGSRSIH